MTTPSTNIAVSDVSTELGLSSTYSASLSFLNGYVKPSIRQTNPALSQFRGLTYFQNNTEGNCDNGNCTSNCNCGNIQCTNCYITGQTNCTNCDSQAYLQSNCNCSTGYNCEIGSVSYNCNCNCNCGCCVVATELTNTGEWDYSQLTELTNWAEENLVKGLAERFHRGYHIIGPKLFIPCIKKKGLLGRYFAWTFEKATDLLLSKDRLTLWSIPNSCFWIGAMTITGFLVSKRTARRTWIRMYREIK